MVWISNLQGNYWKGVYKCIVIWVLGGGWIDGGSQKLVERVT